MSTITASELLGIVRPEDLFPGDPDKAKARYRELARRWHPDAGGNGAVFAHITGLYAKAVDRLNRGVWEGSAVLTLQTAAGPNITFAIRASSPFELGQSLVSDDQVSYIIETEHLDLVKKFISGGVHFKYANEKMRDEISRYLPKTLRYTTLIDGRLLVQIEKTPDLIRLRDVVTHLGTLDPKHTAWIVSSLLNLACYLDYTDLVHHDISPDTYFISPKYHSGALLGGWWYAASEGTRITRVPKRTFNVMPFRSRLTKLASRQTDLELIRATARECLRRAPEPMNGWLRDIGRERSIDQYREWRDILEKTFGPPKFTAMLLDADTVYGSKVVTT